MFRSDDGPLRYRLLCDAPARDRASRCGCHLMDDTGDERSEARYEETDTDRDSEEMERWRWEWGFTEFTEHTEDVP